MAAQNVEQQWWSSSLNTITSVEIAINWKANILQGHAWHIQNNFSVSMTPWAKKIIYKTLVTPEYWKFSLGTLIDVNLLYQTGILSVFLLLLSCALESVWDGCCVFNSTPYFEYCATNPSGQHDYSWWRPKMGNMSILVTSPLGEYLDIHIQALQLGPAPKECKREIHFFSRQSFKCES